jgi:hypothetical protein
MNQTLGPKVFILGAGCSANCGYPLGKGLVGQLEEFQSEITGRFPIIEQCVRDTINLAKQFPKFDTLDQLTKHAEDDFESWRRRERSIVWDNVDQQRQNLLDKQIADAKIATGTMFLAKEEKAQTIGLQSYERFIASIFGGEPWQEAVKDANCHVLTFNYDRLFEIAFLNHFKHYDSNFPLYGSGALNSGFNPSFGQPEKVEIKPGQFSFLKLHGSAGWWVKKNLHQTEQRYYWPVAPTHQLNLQEIEDLLKKHRVYSSEALNSPNGAAFPWEALITFPHEKQRSLENRQFGFSYNPYICAVWDHAASLLASAAQVKVIGYSFSAIDNRHMVETLLNKAKQCQKIVIQNPAVQNVKAALASYMQLSGRLEFDASLFGENL